MSHNDSSDSSNPSNPTNRQTPSGKLPAQSVTAPSEPHPDQTASRLETDRRRGNASRHTSGTSGGTTSIADTSRTDSQTSQTDSQTPLPGTGPAPGVVASPDAAGAQTQPATSPTRQARDLGRISDTSRYGSQQSDGSESIMSRLALMARERPGMVMGAAVGSGFLLALLWRLGRSRASRRQKADQATGLAGDYRPSSTRARSQSSSTPGSRSTGIGLYPDDRPTY